MKTYEEALEEMFHNTLLQEYKEVLRSIEDCDFGDTGEIEENLLLEKMDLCEKEILGRMWTGEDK